MSIAGIALLLRDGLRKVGEGLLPLVRGVGDDSGIYTRRDEREASTTVCRAWSELEGGEEKLTSVAREVSGPGDVGGSLGGSGGDGGELRSRPSVSESQRR